MGSDKTDTTQPMCGFILPYPCEITSTLDTDYTIAAKEIQGFTPSGSTTLALEAVGSTDLTADVTVSVAKAAPPGNLGGGFAYTVGGNTYGAEGLWHLTGHQGLNESGDLDYDGLSMAKLWDTSGRPDGRVMLAWLAPTAAEPQVMIRAADGTWGTASNPTGIDTALGIAVVGGRNGDVYLYTVVPRRGSGSSGAEYTIQVMRYDGTSWTVQSEDALVAGAELGSDVRRICVARAPDGETMLFVTQDTGTNSEVRQFWSPKGIVFYERGEVRARMTVWDAVHAQQAFHILTSQQDDGTDDPLVYRRAGASGTELSNTTAVEISSDWDHDYGAAIDADADGTLYVAGCTLSSGVVGYRSIDGGTTWGDFGASGGVGGGPTIANSTAASTERPDQIAMRIVRREAIAVLRASSDDFLIEATFGGDMDVTVAPDIDRGSDSAWLPLVLLKSSGYTAVADSGGTPTRILSPTLGELCTCAAGVTANYYRSSGTSSTQTCAGMDAIVRVTTDNSGAGGISLKLGNNDQTCRCDITTTGIRIYKNGGSAPSYTNHGASEYLWLRLVIARSGVNQATARVYYRPYTPERPWTTSELSVAMVLAGSGSNEAGITVHPESSAYIRMLKHYDARRDLTAARTGVTGPTDLAPVYIGPSLSYLTGEVYARVVRGVPLIDGVTHTATRTSVYAADNMLPLKVPSPQQEWRSADASSSQTFTITLTHPDRAPLIGMALLNLRNVTAWTWVAKNAAGTQVGAGTGTVDLDLSYDSVGTNSVVGAYSGADVQGRWFRDNELVGCTFELASGQVRTVTGNTSGTLASGSTAAEHRAVLYLDGANDGASAGAGLLHLRNIVKVALIDDEVATVEIALSGDSTGDDIRCGCMMVGRFYALPRVPDLSNVSAIDSGVNVTTLSDGRRYSAREANDRRRLELSWVGSWHEMRQALNDTEPNVSTGAARGAVSPDYIVHAEDGGVPVGDRWALPLVLEGIYTRAAGEVVYWVPRYVQDDGDSDERDAMPLDGMLCRIRSGFRREHVEQIGQFGWSQVARVSGWTLEEEL